MKLQRSGTLAGLAGIALTAALAMTACGTDDNTNPGNTPTGSSTGSADCASGSLTAQGSSAQGNAMAQWVKDYQTKCSGAKVDYQASSSGAGQQAFIAGTADFAGSDSPLPDTDQPKADSRCGTGKAVHLPMVVGPIAVVFNVNGVTDLTLKPATIAKIFSGAIKKWNDPAIAADNQGATLPATDIISVHRNDSSGTSDNFTKYLAGTAASDWTFGHDKVWKAPGGNGQKGSDGISSYLGKTDGTIGYVEWSFAQVNNLKTAKVVNGAGEATALSAEAAGKTVASAQTAGANASDLKLTIDYNTKAAGAYPIVLVTYEIVCDQGNQAGKVALLKSFLTYTSSTAGQQSLTSIGYAPLPDEVRTKVATAVAGLS